MSQLKETLEQLIARTAAQPQQAVSTFSAQTALREGLTVDARIRQFDLIIDEPTSLGGADLGPNPVELVLAALGACQEIVYKAYATVLGIPLQGVEVKVYGDIDLRGFLSISDRVPSGFGHISYETILYSDAPEADLEKLRAVAEAHCPVLDTLQRPITVRGTVSHRRLQPVA